MSQTYIQITYTFPSIFPPQYKIDVSYQSYIPNIGKLQKEQAPSPCAFFFYKNLSLSI